MSAPSHHWIHGGARRDRAALLSAVLPAESVSQTVDAHARLRGPYTGTGVLLREIVPDALRRMPELVRRHDIELLTAAPELRAIVKASRETLTSLAIPTERTRNYARLRTLRIAHGIAEFVRDYLAATAPRTVVWENVHLADHTDLEVLSVLLRRLAPELLRTVVCSAATPVLDEPLHTAVHTYARHHEVTTSIDDPAPNDAAARYVAGDCVSDDERLQRAYAALDEAQRRLLHDARAEELTARDEITLRLGAIPFHRGHGGDPAGAGATALEFAVNHCFDHGLYHATIDLSRQGLAAIADDTDHPLWWLFTVRMATPLAVLGRTDEAQQLYQRAQAATEDPNVHMQVAYSLAMLHTRHIETGQRDHVQAKALVNQAIIFTQLVFQANQRAFQTVFMRNGLALVEVHLGNLARAEQLVTEGIDRLDEVLAPGEQLLHRSVLRYNRCQVYAGLGRLAEALADCDAAIAADPHHAEYHFDRGNLLRRMGRGEEALASYSEVMRLSPPFSEAYYNRADLLRAEGELEASLRDFEYVLELDPDWLDARVNRAGLLAELGEFTQAREEAQRGLAVDPANPFLHCVLGQVLAEQEEYAAALSEFGLAIEQDATLITALAGHASCAYQLGDPVVAVDELTRAVELSPDDPALRFNRAVVYQALERWDESMNDLNAALALAPDDEDVLAAIGQQAAGRP